MSEKWVDKVTNISKVNGRMVVGKVLVHGIISLISVYALQYGLDHSQKDNFIDSLIDDVRKFGKVVKKSVVIAEDFNGHVSSNAKKLWEPEGRLCFWS